MNLDGLPPAIRRKLDSMDLDALPEAPERTRAEELAETRAYLAAQRAEVALGIWRRTCPPLHAEARLADFDNAQQREAAAKAATWLRGDGLTFILAGPVGVGKSRMACAIAAEAAQDGERAVFTSGTAYLKANRPEGDTREARHAAASSLLVVDDVGVTKGSEWAADTMTDLMERRINYGLRTVVTTNVTSRQLGDLYGPRFMDRLNYRATAATIVGASRRA